MVYDDRPDPDLNGHWFKDDACLIFKVFGAVILIGLGIIYLVIP